MVVNFNELTSLLIEDVAPATGCTEPVAVAYSVAVAKENSAGEIKKVDISVSPNIYKNGYYVMVPGTEERGLLMGAAIGLAAGKPNNGFRVIEGVTKSDINSAKKIIEEGKVKISVKNEINSFYIETLLTTDAGKVRVITVDKHLNIVDIQKGDKFDPYILNGDKAKHVSVLNSYSLDDYLSYANNVSIADIEFLAEGFDMNLKVAEEGLKMHPKGIGHAYETMIGNNVMPDHMTTYAQLLCSSASEARMLGSTKPVMSVSGSGNVGITVYLVNYAVAEKNNINREKLVRATALSILILAHVKSQTGALSTMCSCGIAAGLGASVGVVFLLGGDRANMYNAMLNILGSITGMICDGAKEGCAYKLALSANWSIQCALLSINGASINPQNGILSPKFNELISNINRICNPGMVNVDNVVLDILAKPKPVS